jgi:hypothetical protein
MEAREPNREMRGVAESYAAELSAQFRRLNNFVTSSRDREQVFPTPGGPRKRTSRESRMNWPT